MQKFTPPPGISITFMQALLLHIILYAHIQQQGIATVHSLACTVIPLTFLLAKEPTQFNDV